MEQEAAGVFYEIKQKKELLLKQGKQVYDMSIGTPDFLPVQDIIETITKACEKPENYKYAVTDLPELQDALIGHYKRRFGVMITRDEMTSINGTQEGMAHIFLALCNPEDTVLIPNPGYPIFEDGAAFAKAEIYKYPLLEENHFLPDLKGLPIEVVRRAKVMVVSYPLNPVGMTAPDSFYEQLIAFAKENEIIIIHDNAYSDIIFGGRRGKSFLAFKGAKEIGMEFFSLSKSYNLTGARISFAVGNREIITQFKKLRSRIDYGMFLPLQYGAISALEGEQQELLTQCQHYEERSRRLCQGFRDLGWQVPDSQGSMFVWCRVPKHFHDGEAFCKELLERAGVICTPGNYFGTLGAKYVRFALVIKIEEIENMLQAIKESGILNKDNK